MIDPNDMYCQKNETDLENVFTQRLPGLRAKENIGCAILCGVSVPPL